GVPDRAGDLRGHADDVALGHVHDLVLQLELERPRGHEVDLLLRPVTVAVAPLAARERRHPAPGEAHLLGAEVARGAHAHLTRVVAQHVRDLRERPDRVTGHLTSTVRGRAALAAPTS